MRDEIQINRVSSGFSSHTLSRLRPSRASIYGTSGDANALREKLIAAAVEVLAEDGDPRLRQSRALS
jgi:hypothetical protein